MGNVSTCFRTIIKICVHYCVYNICVQKVSNYSDSVVFVVFHQIIKYEIGRININVKQMFPLEY